MTVNYEALVFCKKLWTIFGICKSPESNFIGIIFNLTIVINNLILCVTSLKLLIFEYYSTPITALSFALLQMISSIACGGSYALIAINKELTADIINDIRYTVRIRCDRFCDIHYKKAENVSTFVTKWFAPLNICLFVVSLLLLTIGFLIHDLMKGEIDVREWYNLLQIR